MYIICAALIIVEMNMFFISLRYLVCAEPAKGFEWLFGVGGYRDGTKFSDMTLSPQTQRPAMMSEMFMEAPRGAVMYLTTPLVIVQFMGVVLRLASPDTI